MVKNFSFSLTFITKYPPCTFFAGQTLSAILMVEVDHGNELSVKQISAEFLGIAKCSWGSGSNTKRNGQELFFRKQILLNFGNPQKNGTDFLLLQKGVHGFKLDCRLPKDLPSSLKVSRGYIFYEVWVTIRHLPPSLELPLITTPHPKICQTTESFPFKLNAIFDLSTFLSTNGIDHNQPILLNDRVKLHTWNVSSLTRCGGGGGGHVAAHIFWKIVMPRSGFSLGQQINFTVEIVNQSKKTMRHLLVQLVQEVKYKANDDLAEGSLSTVHPIGRLRIILDRKGPCHLSIEDEIQIPCFPLPTTTPHRCNVVKIGYFVRFTLCFVMHRVVKMVPIIVGSF